jgi:TRAP-type mannitol/chloroaromatic compound transport system permease large subunit
MHPPFGFALFYLRSVAPSRGTIDRVTGQVIAPITTGQIYWGAIPFVMIQLIMVGVLIGFPDLVLSSLDRGSKIDPSKIRIEAPPSMPNELPQFEFK